MRDCEEYGTVGKAGDGVCQVKKCANSHLTVFREFNNDRIMKGKGSQVREETWHQNHHLKTPITKPYGADFDINVGFIFSNFKPLNSPSKQHPTKLNSIARRLRLTWSKRHGAIEF